TKRAGKPQKDGKEGRGKIMVDAVTNVKSEWKTASSPAAQGTLYRKGTDHSQAKGWKEQLRLGQSNQSSC
ncbi:mCG66109, partial [Mus musculus]